ncbi:hypothetical protein ACFS5M_12565 [Lacinutrix iliipiscaria]|uniref:Uncharacterized protein n=1 Tax=Lacinutrix iliipiscaria TaxID=1230532 RepID=A0ABW5WP48_9FLAO
MNLNKTYYIIFLISLSWSCKSPESISNYKPSSNINTEFNTAYFQSSGSVYGTLDKAVYDQIKTAIELELSTTIPESKSILINFRQDGRNCFSMKNNGKSYLNNLKGNSKTSSRISSQNNAVDFFIFSKKSYFNDVIKMEENFFIDSGFFYQNIFTEHENCSAFLVIKPNGKFMKYYGVDYFTKAKNFLELD